MRTIAIFALALFGADAVRDSATDQVEDQKEDLVTCNALGNAGSAAGMTVTWGVPKKKCISECGPTSSNDNMFTYQREFMSAFTTSLNKRCECSAGGKVVAAFKPKSKEQASQCVEGTSKEIHQVCWDMYMRGRGTRFSNSGKLKVPIYAVPFTPSDFVVNRGCSKPCPDGSCVDVRMPGALDGMPIEDKVAVGQAIKKIMDGESQDVSDALIQLISMLPQDDTDVAEFLVIDINGDGQLSTDELAAFYTHFKHTLIVTFVGAADSNGDGQIDFSEFKAFKEEMRNYNPNVDLVTGDAVKFVIEDGEVHEVKAEWKAVAVQCMKSGKPAPEEECTGTAEEALVNFHKSC